MNKVNYLINKMFHYSINLMTYFSTDRIKIQSKLIKKNFHCNFMTIIIAKILVNKNIFALMAK